MTTRETRQTIDKLHNNHEPLNEEELIHLSNLTREEQGWLEEAWPLITLDKRRRLVQLLGEQADADFQLDFTAVFRRGLRDEDATVRQRAIEGLWEDESVTLIRPLLRLLQDEVDAVQAAAATALGRFVLQGELGYLTEERYHSLVEELMHVIADAVRPVAVRRRAVEAVAYSSDERVRGIIARAYEDEAEPMRLSALFAMGRSADEYWRGMARAELWNENPAFRYEAARAAGELGDSVAVPRLIALLGDADREVREMTIWALGQIGGPAARKALEGVVQHSNSPARRQLARDSLAEMALLHDANAALLPQEALLSEAGGNEDLGALDELDDLDEELTDDEADEWG